MTAGTNGEQKIGRVRWFSTSRGYGFVVEEKRNKDIFLHYSAIQTPGYKALAPGQRVAFVIVEGERGPTARDVVPICDEPAS